MFFTNFDIKPKTLRIFSVVLTLIGIVFILASNYVGNITIRITMLIAALILLINYKASSPFASIVEKIYMILGIVGTIVVFALPQLTMLIVGIGILFASVPAIYKTVKSKKYSDKLTIVLSIVGVLFSIYCIINSKAALNTAIKIIGIAFAILGCIILFTTFDIQKKSKSTKQDDEFNETDGINEIDEFRFENAEETEVDEDK